MSLVKICLITLIVNLKLCVIKLYAVTAFEYFHCMQSIALIVLIAFQVSLNCSKLSIGIFGFCLFYKQACLEGLFPSIPLLTSLPMHRYTLIATVRLK